MRISEDGTLSDGQKAAQVLTLYRDTADDVAGAAARKTIASFAAETMPTLKFPKR